ncbi:MAG: molybdopterin-dependent oxidoreductase [Nitrospirales bacterium]
MVHLTLVVVVQFPEDVSDMVLGATNPNVTLALRIVSIWLIGVVLFPIWGTIYTLRHQQRLQIQGTAISEPVIRFLFGGLRYRQHFTKDDISPYFRGNDSPSEIESYQRLARENFAPWKLTVGGLVEHPLTLSLDDLRAFPKPEQITKYNRIQVWSAVGQWGSDGMSTILDKCRPLPQTRYVVFNAFAQAEYAPDVYDEVLTLEEITTSPTMLAYEMNWNSLPVPHVAPFRLPIAIKAGYRMVKYLCAIEVVDSVDKIVKRLGGYREDLRYDDKIAAI